MIVYWAWEKDGKKTVKYKVYTEDEYWDGQIASWPGVERHARYTQEGVRIAHDYILPAAMLVRIPDEELVHVREWGIWE